MLETGRAGDRPRPRERVRVACVRQEDAVLGQLRREVDVERRDRVDVGDQPRLGAVREVRVGEQVDRRAVLDRDPDRLERAVEAVARRRRGDHGHRVLGVPPVEHHQEVGLLGLRRHPGRRPSALHVDDQQRQLEHHREPDRLRLQDDPGAGRRADAERAAEACAERRADRGDLVLRLEGAHAELLVVRELLEDPRRRSDRVRAEEERQLRFHRRGDQAVRERLVAGDLAVEARRERRRLHLVLDEEVLGGLAVVVARVERTAVRLGDLGSLRELRLDELVRVLGGSPVQPRHQAKREEVLRALGLARRDAVDPLQRLDRHRGQRHRVELVLLERAVVERAGRVAGLLQVLVRERIAVEDQRAAARQVPQVRAQRSRVHRHEHVGAVARREDVVVGEVDLEPRDSRQRPRGRTDLRRVVGKGREVVAERGGLAREAAARELHAVAGIAGEPDHDVVDLLDLLRHCPPFQASALLARSHRHLRALSGHADCLRAAFFVRYLVAELGRRRGRTVLTALGLAIGVALVIVVNALSSGLDRAQAHVLEPLTGLGTDIGVTRPLDLGSDGFEGLSDSERQQLREENGGGRIGLRDLGEPGTKFSRDTFVSGQLSIPADEVSSVRALDGVQDAAGSLTLNALHIEGTVPEQPEGGFRGQAPTPGGPDSIDTQSMTATGVDVTRPELAPVSPAEIESGRYIGEANEAVLNVGYARRSDLVVGDTITLGGAELTVVGLAKPPLGGQASDVYVSLAKLQQLADRKGRVNAINVRTKSSDDVAAVTSAIEGQLDGASVTTAADVAERVSGSLVDAQNLSGKLGAALVVIGLGAAFLIASLLTLASVAKRTRELGTLKALGWSQRLVVRQVTGEALLQASWAQRSGLRWGCSVPLCSTHMGRR